MSIATNDFPYTGAALEAATPAGGDIARVEVFDSLDAAEPVWRELEADAIQTPYQSRAWVGAWKRHVSPTLREKALIVAAFDAAGTPLVIMPLAMVDRAGMRLARPFGGKHVNYNLPIFQRHAMDRLPAASVAEALREAARARDVDAILMPNQPRQWLGRENPLAALGGSTSPSNSFRADLSTNIEDRATGLSRAGRRKLRQKEKLLSESGPVLFGRADTPAAIKDVIDAYQAQKAEWFVRNGGRNVFADPAIDNFLRAGALSGLADGNAAIEVYYLSAGPHIAATFAGTVWDTRFSGMILSADVARFGRSSPGELLLSRVVDHMIERGMTSLDLGVGDARYKKAICPIEEHLVDVSLPLTPAGHVAARAWHASRRGRGWAKRNEQLTRLRRMGCSLRAR